MDKGKIYVRPLLISIIGCLLVIKGGAQPFMTNITGRHGLSLNGVWQVIVDWYGYGDVLKIYKDAPPVDKAHFNEYSFDGATLRVPSDWNHQLPELNYFEGSIWYKKVFRHVVKAGKRNFLYFGGVNYRADVYLNGELLGRHEGGFTPFQFEVTGKIKTGNNSLILKVNNTRVADGIPATGFDWWNYGGITRDVQLVETSSLYIADYFLQLKKGSSDQVEGWVKLDGCQEPEKIRVRIPEAGVSIAVSTDAAGYAGVAFRAGLTLWSPEHPKRYRVSISSTADTIAESIGFRNIEVQGTQVFLNGRPIFLRGVNFHEEIGRQGRRAVSEADAKELLMKVKALGCNFARLTHYPQNEHTVRMAEQLGILLWEEIPVWQDIKFTDTVLMNKASSMLAEMVTRDRNRCAVIIWSLSNETKPDAPGRNAVLRNMAARCRQLDPTRLISSAFDHFDWKGDTVSITDPLGADLDLLGANLYMGWYVPWPGRPGGLIWKDHYHKPLVFSEFGAEAHYGTHRPADSANGWTEEFQEQVYKDNLRMFAGISFLAGTCPWNLSDFRSPFRMNARYQRGWNRKGLLSDKGDRKKTWYVMQDFYRQKKRPVPPAF